MILQPNLERECRLFSHYLIDLSPSDYVLSKYQEAHRFGSPPVGRPIQRFDSIVLWLALKNPFILRLADTYASLFYKQALLRRKLVLLLAILECSPGAFDQLDRPEKLSRSTLYGLLLIKGLRLIAITVLAICLLAPIHATCAVLRQGWDR